MLLFFLHQDLPTLNLGTMNKSWWLENGIGCKVNDLAQVKSTGDPLVRKRPHEEDVEGCILQYYYIEVIQGVIHCVVAVS